jgi:predicted nuclease with TOPRIM domain
MKERDTLLGQNTELKSENSTMRERLDAVTDQLIRLNERLAGLLEKEQRRRK